MMKHQLLFFPFLASFLCYTQCLARKEDVYIPVLAPMFGIENDRFGFVTAMKYAFELINNRSDILRDYRLVAEYHDTIASTPVALYELMEIFDVHKCKKNKTPPVILGPAFSQVTIPVAQAVSLIHTIQFAYGATSPVLDDRGTFQTLIRTLPGTSTFNRGNIALMKKFNWKRVGIFYDHHEHDSIFSKITEDLIQKVQMNNFTVVGVESVHAGSSALATTDDEIAARLEKLKAADIKIFFGQFRWVGAYRIFCQVYKLGMYGENFVWIVHPRADTVSKWMKASWKYPHLKTSCTEEQYWKVSEGMFFMDQQQYRSDSIKTISGMTGAQYNKWISSHRVKHPKDKIFHNSTSHAYGFDAVWIVALTLNESIGALKTINATISKPLWRNYKQMRIMKKSVFNVKFEGITGPISFDRQWEDRMGTLTLYQIRGKKILPVGSFAASNDKLDIFCDKDLWIDGVVPLDISVRETVLQTIPTVLYTIVCIVAGMGILLAIIFLVFNIYNRDKRYIRKSAPTFNNIIVFGIMLCLSTVFFFGLPVKLGETEKVVISCKLCSWVLCLGFSLSYGSMFVKTWRVYKIFTNRKLKFSLERLSNKSLFIMIISIVVADLIILLLWEYLDPMEVKINSFAKETHPENSNTVLVPILYTCHSRHQNKWVTAIYSVKGILLLYGLFLAYETRNVQFEHLNDSRMIGVSVYNVAVMSVLGGLLRIILNEAYFKEAFGMTSACIIFPSLGTLFLIFLPKVVRFAKSGEVNQDGVVIEGPEANNGNNFHLRKDSVESEGITSVTSVNSSLPCSNSLRIMPIYEEAIMSASEASPQTLRPGALTLSSLRRKSVS